ncbi:[histone H3]-lysine(4) N-trimethyltransferase [Malassezia vespertilionis]|uniref:Set9p n=1 Tax=Malassezia vespertilionis TaxID=2020962 RepID=A0A2N1J9V2_9BASI|nr:[histone H3]-lysine(4) N-trimethyltransferase [Malassezia vespertilionis]PKI83333.1 Set9p [Malassezia vespertilionis]WFD07744.1 [histone H3]-lysine(4) N-trimethyltransferase [Malassezia vespertilionis]
MEELAADDDLLSSMLLDTLEFEPAITTHKMNPLHRNVRFDRDVVSRLVRQHVIWDQNVPAAVAAFMDLPVIKKHTQRKTPAQLRVFELCVLAVRANDRHIQRYLQAYLPDAGFEYALTFRYRTAFLRQAKWSEADEDAPRAASGTGAVMDRADLCVLSTRAFAPDETMTFCRAALKDLSHAEDEELRQGAQQARAACHQAGHSRPRSDFSIIRSSSRKCSQLLLGPARYINHDCHPNAEFRRSGHQISIQIIRPVRKNEEITTYYGDNYFEPGNKECMCATCERLGRNFYAQSAPHETPAAQPDARLLRSVAHHAPPRNVPEHDRIAIQLDPDAQGAEVLCITCNARFRAPERWWTPDECMRCERHYKLYQRDWPNRTPQEHRAERTRSAPEKKRTARTTKRVGKRGASSSAEPFLPVKLSPVRAVHSDTSDAESADRHLPRRKYEVRSDDSDENFDEHHVTLGPRILGHQASTDVLASYWGATEGPRRARRRPNHDVYASALQHGPRTKQHDGEHDGAHDGAHDGVRATSLPPAVKRVVHDTHKRSASSSHARDKSKDAVAAPSAAPKASAPSSAAMRTPPIATSGAARTSVSNLALFWSGGVAGRTRGQARASSETRLQCMASAGAARARSESTERVPKPDAGRAEKHGAPNGQGAETPRPSVPAEHVLRQDTALPPMPSVVRQPARRNLRWGNGKTSASRVLPIQRHAPLLPKASRADGAAAPFFNGAYPSEHTLPLKHEHSM